MSPQPGGFSRGAFRRMAAEPPKSIPSLKRLKRHFGRFLLQHKWAIALGTSCVTLGLLMSKLQPLIIRFLVDEALTPILKGPRTPELYLHSRWLVMITLGGMLVVSLLRSGISRLHMRTMRRAGAMLVRDLRPDRLSRAVREVGGLIDRLQGDRVALIAFSGDARDVAPLTHDRTTLKALLGRVSPEDNKLGGTDLGAALQRALTNS